MYVCVRMFAGGWKGAGGGMYRLNVDSSMGSCVCVRVCICVCVCLYACTCV